MQRDVVRTGIKGLDTILIGGLPRGNITVITGGPGTGKTILGLEFIYRGAREFDEPGIIVTFEVSSDRLIADAATFGWDLRELEERAAEKSLHDASGLPRRYAAARKSFADRGAPA